MTTDVIDHIGTMQQLEALEATERPRPQEENPVPAKQLLRWQDDGGAVLPSEEPQLVPSGTTATAQLAP